MKSNLPPINPPFHYNRLSQDIWDANNRMIADVRGWGWMQKLDDAEDVQDAMGELIAEALNEKFGVETPKE